MISRLPTYVEREMGDRCIVLRINRSPFLQTELWVCHYLSIEEGTESLQIPMKFLLRAVQTAIFVYKQAVKSIRGQSGYYVGSLLES
jgi:hypothetical protein